MLSNGLNVKYYHLCLFCEQSSSDRVVGASSSRSRLAPLTCVHHSLMDFKSPAPPALPIPAWSQPLSKGPGDLCRKWILECKHFNFALCRGEGRRVGVVKQLGSLKWSEKVKNKNKNKAKNPNILLICVCVL